MLYLKSPDGYCEKLYYNEITVYDNKKILVDGLEYISEYNSDTVKIKSGNKIIKICGNNLAIRNMSSRKLMISGDILSLEFLTVG